MKNLSVCALFAAVAACAVTPLDLMAQESAPVPPPALDPAGAPTAVAAAPAPKSIRYKPPVTSGPAVRATGGTRGGGDKLPFICVLAPEQIALTTQGQPALFWFQSAPAKANFELTLTEPKKVKPLLVLTGGASEKAGIHSVSLSRHNITLEPGVAYQWSVAIIGDAANRSKDLIASGMIQRVEAPADLAAKIEASSGADRAVVYAQAGYWYDALQTISVAIGAHPKDAQLRQLRASLLEQAKLPEAAAAERK